MQVDIRHLEQGLLKLYPADETWNAKVAAAMNNLKSELVVSDEYQFNVELKNPLQLLIDELNSLIAAFQQLINDNLIQPLITIIQAFKDLLTEILLALVTLQSDIDAAGDINEKVGDINAFCTKYSGKFIKLMNDFRSATVQVISNIYIHTPTIEIANNIEVDVVHHFEEQFAV